MLRVSVSQSSLQVDLSGLRTGDSQALDAIPNARTLIRLADAFMNHEPDPEFGTAVRAALNLNNTDWHPLSE